MGIVGDFLKIALAAVVLALTGAAAPLLTGGAAPDLSSIAWEALAVLLMGGALWYPALRSRWRGWRLAAALFLLAGGVNALLVALEMAVFVGPPEGFTGMIVWWLLRAGGLSLALVLVLGRWGATGEGAGAGRPARLSPAGWLWRIAVCVAAYTILFMVAGILIMKLEAVPDYNAPEHAATSAAENAAGSPSPSDPPEPAVAVRVPPPQVVFGFVFVRGLACVAFSLPLLFSLAPGRWTAGLAVGVALAVLGGVAPLLAPNALMTTAARLAHMLEIGWSNLAFGLVIGALFGGRRSGPSRRRLGCSTLDREAA